MRDAGRRRRGQRELGQRPRTEEGLHHRSGRAGHDAVRAGIFRMHRRGPQRVPRGVALGLRIAVDIPVADGRDRPPELVVVLGIEDGHHCIGCRHRDQREQAGVLVHAEPLGLRELHGEWHERAGPGVEPEASGLRLYRSARRAVLRSNRFDLVVVLRPLAALQVDRRSRPELRPALHRERRDLTPHGDHDRRRRDVAPGGGPRAIAVGLVRAVVGAQGQEAVCDLLSECDTLVLGGAVRNLREVLLQLGVDLLLIIGMQLGQDNRSGHRGRRLLGGRRRRVELGLVRLVARLDGIHALVHG